MNHGVLLAQNLAPLRIISIHQLKMMISVSGSLGGGTPLDLRTSKVRFIQYGVENFQIP